MNDTTGRSALMVTVFIVLLVLICLLVIGGAVVLLFRIIDRLSKENDTK